MRGLQALHNQPHLKVQHRPSNNWPASTMLSKSIMKMIFNFLLNVMYLIKFASIRMRTIISFLLNIFFINEWKILKFVSPSLIHLNIDFNLSIISFHYKSSQTLLEHPVSFELNSLMRFANFEYPTHPNY